MTPTFFRLSFRRWAALLLLVGAAVFLGVAPCHAEFRTHDLWWASEPVTKHGHRIDELMMFIFWLTLAVFVVTQVVYIYFLVKYRRRKGVKAVYSHGNNKLEIIWTMTPAAIFIVLAVVSDKMWFELRSNAPANALHIDLVAYQFGFHIRNPGADDKLGESKQEWMQMGSNNFGLNTAHPDPASNDDFQTENQITLPVNRPVNIVLRSQDVIHAFYVPEFRMYQDIVPGMTISWVWFVPEKEGHYTLACNQLCGSGHYNMQAAIDVVSQKDYDKLVKEKSAAAVKAHAASATAEVAPAGDSPVVAALHP